MWWLDNLLFDDWIQLDHLLLRMRKNLFANIVCQSRIERILAKWKKRIEGAKYKTQKKVIENGLESSGKFLFTIRIKWEKWEILFSGEFFSNFALKPFEMGPAICVFQLLDCVLRFLWKSVNIVRWNYSNFSIRPQRKLNFHVVPFRDAGLKKKNSNRFCTRRMWLTTGLSHPLCIMQFTSVLSMCLTKAARLLCSTCCVIDILGWREEKIRWRQPTCDSLYCGSLHLQRRVAQVATGQTPRSRCGDGSQTRVPYVMMTLDTIRSTFRSNLCLSLPLHCGIIKFFFLSKNQVPPHWDVFERITFTVKDNQMKDLQRFCPCFPTIIFSCFTCRQQDVSRKIESHKKEMDCNLNCISKASRNGSGCVYYFFVLFLWKFAH